jgi:hypothetical protein
MAKSRTLSFKNVGKGLISSSKRALPAVNKGLTKVGSTAKDVAQKSIPIIEKGASVVYDTMATGFDLGVKGANTVAKGVKNITKKRHSKRRSHRRRSHRRH